MKKIKILLGIIITVIAFTSCNDYLEEENLSNVAAEEFYLTEEGFESLITANYSQLREIYGDEPWLFSAGTDLYAEGRQQEPPGLSQYSQLTPSSEGVEYLYDQGYEAIQIANMALHYSEITEQNDEVDLRVGEIKYLRANAYFLLVQTYGGVPLVTDYISDVVLEFDRSSAEEIYDFIISELEGSLSLVEGGNYIGRVNKRAVRHLLAKVYLTRAYEEYGSPSDFETAANYADEAIAGQELNLSFEELWWPGNDLNEEVIFSVQFDQSSVSTDPQNLGHTQSSFFGPAFGGVENAGIEPYRTFTLVPTGCAVDLFEEGDDRWEGTFMVEMYEQYYDFYRVQDHSNLAVLHYYAPKWENSPADQAAYEAEHPEAVYHPYGTYFPEVSRNFDYYNIAIRKFDDPGAPYGEGRVSTRDIILSRLGETYLIAAEAYLMAGNNATGLERLNVVRERANADPATLSEFTIDYILDERGRELMGEYHRWFDLKRTGKLVERASACHYLIEESNFEGANGELKILRPIPQLAIDLNRNPNFQQNPAYQ
ncbi:RagB/SusD family nutrient uptake outer membrane protein [Autumnicola edwardsiae]|uniref:RagB/SusD family nutrient uptake outer membrane protein n=1 Tax=Autumnicola edwardsiae TaxID=3075594 RepID=A0ABU3CUE8_9FLAO|nr:RagB/SusD family nutrient uptake outer membrane protein [Zunongwangia sp. F297]MDT0649540.1 RagB/SusD family nutrient uptake outer membrane protein [Zunongwangia sp. F297]